MPLPQAASSPLPSSTGSSPAGPPPTRTLRHAIPASGRLDVYRVRAHCNGIRPSHLCLSRIAPAARYLFPCSGVPHPVPWPARYFFPCYLANRGRAGCGIGGVLGWKRKGWGWDSCARKFACWYSHWQPVTGICRTVIIRHERH